MHGAITERPKKWPNQSVNFYHQIRKGGVKPPLYVNGLAHLKASPPHQNPLA